MFGMRASEAQFRYVNSAAVLILLVVSAVPLLLLNVWLDRRWRPILWDVCWVVSVAA
jgi:hypothetical protein